MRRLLLTLPALLLALTPLLGAIPPAAAAESPRILLNGVELELPDDQKPVIISDRTLVPLRIIFEALRAEVVWEGDLRRVTARKGGLEVILQIGIESARVNGAEVTVNPPPQLIGSRTYVPLRFVSESLGAQVDWEAESRTVLIVTPDGQKPVTGVQRLSALQAAPGAFRRTLYEPGAMLNPDREGAYFMNATTGKTEGWSMAGEMEGVLVFGIGPDNRYVVARTESTGYLADRTTQKVISWNRAEVDLVTAIHGRLLFEGTRHIGGTVGTYTGSDFGPVGHLEGTRKYWVLADTLEIITEFQLEGEPGAQTVPDQALFAPGGGMLALTAAGGLWMIDVKPDGQIKRLADGTGTLQDLPGVADRTEFAFLVKGEGSTSIWKGNWSTGRVGDPRTLPSRRVHLSPDGSLAAWESVAGEFIPTVVISDLVLNNNHRFRADGATACSNWSLNSGPRWVGSQGVAVNTREGRRLITTERTVVAMKALESPRFDIPMAAPGSSGLLAYQEWGDGATWSVGTIRPDGTFGHRLTIDGTNRFFPARAQSLWGSNADEVRFTLQKHWGTGAPCGDFSILMPVRVVTQNVASGSVELQVKGTGDCLNLRETPGLTGKVVACLPDGTRLSPGSGLADGTPRQHWADGGAWVRVKAASGQEGWVMVTSGYVGWATP